MLNKWKKTSTLIVALSLCAGLAAEPAFAKQAGKGPANKEVQQGNKNNKKKMAQEDRRQEIVRKVQNSTHYSYERARRAGMTLEDFIITQYIAERLTGHDFIDVYAMRRNGSPYKEICKANGIKWGWVRRHVKDQHVVMTDEAHRLGLIMWALHEILR